MGLLDNVRGNASEMNPQDAARQFGFILIQGETIVRAYSGGAEIYKQFGKKSDFGAVQQTLAHYVLLNK